MDEKLNPNDWEILTDDGYKSFKNVIKNKNVDSIKLKFDDGTEFICSTDHEILTTSNNFTLAKKSRYKKIKTINGYKTVISIKKNKKIDLYDVTGVDGSKYITNDIISHNCNLLEEFWASVYPIISSSKKSKVIMASTPKDTSGLFYKLYDGSVKKDNNWVHMKVTWDQIPGRDEKWKKETIASLGDPEAFKREFDCEFDQVGEAAIDSDLFESMKKYTFEPLYVYEDGKYLLWEQPNEERIYAAGVDISEGIGKNASVIQILDITEPRNIKQVAVYNNNKISPSEFTPKLREILQHWGDPYALIERNNCGGQVVDNLKREYNYDNLVNWGITKASGRLTNQYGMLAHTNTKLAAVLNQRYWVSIAKTVHINDIHTVLELKDFVRSKNNSWGAKHGSNDDRVMALVWALMILHEDIAPIYFDIIDKDENNKPSIIKSIDYGIRNYINLNSIYTNEKNGLGGDAMPIIMGSNKHSDQPDLDDLYTQGWKPYLG